MPDPFETPANDQQLYDRCLVELPPTVQQDIERYQWKDLLMKNVVLPHFPCKDSQGFAFVSDRFKTTAEGMMLAVEIGRAEGRAETSVAALLELQEADITLALRGTQNSSVYSNKHAKATQTTQQFALKPIPLEEIEKSGIASVFMSILKQKKEGQEAIYYFNESDIQHVVHSLLQDAVETCNALLRKRGSTVNLQYRLEANFWSEKPDHAVVFDNRSSAPLVSIEVKKPTDSKRAFSTYDRVLGQGFDYLCVSKLQGHSCPIHIATTMVESYVAWLPENDFVQKYNAASGDDMGELWGELLRKVQTEPGANTLTQSPLREHGPDQSIRNDDDAPTRENPIQTTAIERIVYTSQCFKRHQLFQVMVNAILCGLNGSLRSPSVPRLSPGDIVRQVALELSATGYKWVYLTAFVRGSLPDGNRRFRGVQARLSNLLALPQMYAVGVVGIGETSKAFRVVTTGGYEGVTKVYVKKHDDDRKCELDAGTFNKKAEQSVSQELAVFQTTYPEMPVSKVQVHKHLGLLMPFFASISADHRKGYEDKIKEQLQHVREGKTHLGYKEEDMRWRHIGLLNGDVDQVRVFDFNDMIEVEASKVEKVAEDHWSTILGRLQEQQDH